MLRFIKKIFEKKSSQPTHQATDEEGDGAIILTKNMKLLEELAAAGDMEFFDGHVEHGYSLANVKDKNQCPRCQAPTRLRYANFIYNNQVKPRVLAAPAGYFCTKCPSVIVDEKLMKKGATPGFEYMGTLGVSYEDNRPPDIFSTYNGNRFDFILGYEGENFFGGDAYSPARWEKIKRKKKMAKESRKRNRRK